MKRYSILVREIGARCAIELCQCDANPEAIVAGAKKKSLRMTVGNRKVDVPKYDHVSFRDNEAKAEQ